MAIVPSDTYPFQTVPDPGYPYGRARNETAPNASNGTPLEAQHVNDTWGFHQSLLVAAGITPSGVPDEVGASDYLDAIAELILARVSAIAIANHVARTPAGSFAGDFYDVAYGGGVVVAVGSGGEIQRSTNRGVTWAQSTADDSYSSSWRGIAYGAGVFVAVGTGGEIQTSPDGVTWTSRDPQGSYSGIFEDVAFGGGLFVAVGRNGEIQTAPDGITWTKRTPAGAFSDDFITATFGGGIFVVGGEDGEIQTSPDGIAWTKRSPDGGYAQDFIASGYGAGVFVLGGLAGGEIQTSRDGITWTHVDAANGYSNPWADVVLFGAQLVMVGEAVLQLSKTGESFRDLYPRQTVAGDYTAAVAAGDVLVLVGQAGVLRTSLAF